MQLISFIPRLGLLAAAVTLASCASTQSPPSEETLRTLSRQEVDGLLNGAGMGMAAVAEINGYPGPHHVLELKDALALTPDQRFATSRLMGLARGQARALGERIVNAERQLDAAMAEGLTSDQLRARLERIASLRAQLRFTHIDAHRRQREILTPEQLARYYRLRGRDVVVSTPPAAPPDPDQPLTLPAPASPESERAVPAYPLTPIEEDPHPPALLPNEVKDEDDDRGQ